MNSLIDYHGFGWKWVYDEQFSNFDPNASLSAALITVEYATASSPIHVLLFHKGTFRGQGTPDAGAFVSILKDECTDTQLLLRIKIPGDSNAGPPKSLHHVKFTYIDGIIYWSGDWPDDFDKPGWPHLDTRQNGPSAES
ncbi:LppP/LprE family lipoprotein [Mycobacterium sp. IDR2000157661]|uniref:LppP/LprE family lipoprotein n=1 Tax=Mycobacterium sp. IDR2000157661 TaxID=2867005 RepID=UPI001EEAD3A9|nr:LppP/LprE family lipoprotein [Mycobacterium sp. IDR2000157661]ULE34365.1 LppP/LprE family lipoprotein [Mycobacterium sp. IDR2000157661]